MPDMKRLQILLILLLPLAGSIAVVADAAPSSKLRVIIETDAGGDPDDEQ